MYNGIGLVTPRGSGTNGYVVRNLSHLRPRDTQQDAHKFDQGPPKHREPDAGILEHERLRKVEVACLELQLELEENNIPEEDIEREVSKLREKLTATITSALPTSAKNIKASDTHGLAAAKKEELSKMARALGTSANYVEGDAFNREKQEELRHQRAAEREEKDRRRDEMRLKREEDSKRWEAERKERDRLRRRQEDQARREREARMPPPQSGRGRDGDSYRRSPPPRDYSPRRRDRSPPRRRSPSPYSRRAYSSRRSRSPPPRRRVERSPSRENSPPPRRSVRSPSPRRGRDSRSASPPRRKPSSSPARDNSPPPRGRQDSRSPSPKRSARSGSAGSAMSVSGSEASN
ncbi:RNA-splicing factor [Ceratobasidium sp. 428]|nr:RNA-splicing factor [Ceratobasidium sp. 428]